MYCKVEVYVLTNFKRKNVNFIVSNFKDGSELFFLIKEKLSEYNNVNIEDGIFKLFNKEQVVTQENIITFIKNNLLKIKFVNIIAPYGALKFYEKNGITYFFHTSEECHKYSPHIHVKLSDHEMKVLLNDFSIIGHLENTKKEKEAVKFIEKHYESIMKEWNRIVNN